MTNTFTIEVDGQLLRVAQLRRSDAPPLLLINGLGASLELLEPFAQALDNIDSIRVDLPGTGGSPAPTIPYRPSGLATLLNRTLDKLGCQTVDVLGISLGGAIAQQFARQHSDRIRRLVLVSTGTGAIMVPGAPSALFSMLTPRRFTDPDYLARVAPDLYGGRLRDNPELPGEFHRMVKPSGSLGYYWQLLGMAGWTSIHWLSRLTQPTLVMSGADDPIVPPANAYIMARLIPNSELHIFDDGHLGLLTSAPELAPIVREFLSKEHPTTSHHPRSPHLRRKRPG
jgi:poly(3-hydroxyalkanoate) depolymerase